MVATWASRSKPLACGAGPGEGAVRAAGVACGHFECVETVDPAACPTRCPAWRVPIIVGLQQLISTAGDPAVCR